MRLEARGLSYAYSHCPPCLRGVSLTADQREIMFLLGANGSGKTTLLACLAGTRSPTAGDVLLDGVSLRLLPPRERAKRIGVVPQFPDVASAFRVEDAVGLGRAPYIGLLSRPGREDRKAVAQAIDAVGLTALRRRSTTQLSGGERQLVWIARGLAQGASCLLMDEPTAHLDPQHEQTVFAVVRRLAASGAGFVVASHHPGSALLYGHKVSLLRDGEILHAGPPGETMTEGALHAVYGMDFTIVEDGRGSRAIVPRVGDPETSSPTRETKEAAAG